MRYTRSAVVIAGAVSLLLAGCGDDADDESIDSALAAAEAEAEALQAELDALMAENEELSAALTAETHPDAEDTAAEVGTEAVAIFDETSEEEASRSIAPDAVDVAERWGEALEARDSSALGALYSPEARIIDRNHRVIWRNADAAIERITNNVLEFADVDLVRVEQVDETDPAFLAVYEATVSWGDPEDEGRPTFFVYFNSFDDDALILEQDIQFNAWRSFVTGEIGYPQRADGHEEVWIIID